LVVGLFSEVDFDGDSPEVDEPLVPPLADEVDAALSLDEEVSLDDASGLDALPLRP
jgi:hypothetical protein